MSQQYPPQRPGYAAPAPKRFSTGKIIGIGCGGTVALLTVIGIFGAALGDQPDDSSSKGSTATADEKGAPAEDTTKEKTSEKSQADQFKDCVAKTGTATERTAVEHVTKVTGADKKNNIIDSAEVFTDYTGGIVGPHASDGKLIASAFASCYESENGLVTVYDKVGGILSNGNF